MSASPPVPDRLISPDSAPEDKALDRAIRPRKLVLTHMSDDMLARLGTLGYETAEDGKVVEF